MPFEVLTPMKISTPPPLPIRVDALK